MNDLLRKFLEQFNRFKAADIDLIIENTTIETFKKGELVVVEGQISDKCYLVLKGCLRQFKIVDETEKTSGFFIEEMPMVIYSSYLDGKPSEFSIQCLEDTILVSGTREKELEMQLKSPILEQLTALIMMSDFRKAERYIALLNNYNPEERYLKFMKLHSNFLNRIPLVHISSYLNVTPESLSRIRKRIVQK
ncbi:CRP-like cAMP-binding protein [Flavobacterium nitrogenifigens]|uniref:CRP-like cAMP-binding protein n=2 Tax=Flavobacterium TaxID=237 RepID=A0A7W7N686_9FLAO|nr:MULTISPECIES: Crp/Fnr family transcriptional regulator [Flavobacterium]MBB4801560.1 CRP-like cAMP-binding protein [Flavobacterium nitrogenifigens]MBB6386517.1 CRP-like cAMP-binding protein [Flavobacterium notoginsengisoli]